MKKKFLITIIILALILLALWIWTLAAPKSAINIGGSASIDPLMQRLTNKYAQEGNRNFIYSSTGSNTGINNLKKDVYDLAFVSKDISEDDFPGLEELTSSDFVNERGTPLGKAMFKQKMYAKGDGYYSVTFTNEPIVFVYNIDKTGLKPDDPFIDKFIFKLAQTLVPEPEPYATTQPQLDSQGKAIIKAIYDHDYEEDFISWYRLAQLLFDGSWDYSGVSRTTQVWPYASVPGSGTWSSFEKITGTEPGEAVNKYGNNGSIFYQILKSPGSFGFISMTYAQTIAKDKNLSKKLRTVGIESNGDVWWVYKNPDKPNYPLTRPFNVVFKLDTSASNRARMDAILDFIYWFCTNSDAESIFKELGLTQTMKGQGSFNFLNFWEHVTLLILKPNNYEETGNDRNQKLY